MADRMRGAVTGQMPVPGSYPIIGWEAWLVFYGAFGATLGRGNVIERILAHLLVSADVPAEETGGSLIAARVAACSGRAVLLNTLLSLGTAVDAPPASTMEALDPNDDSGDRPSIVNGLGRNLLFEAARRGHADVCRVLIAHGVDVHSVHSHDVATIPPVNSVWKDDPSPLFTASRYGFHEVVEILIDANADPNSRKVVDGASAVFVAAQEGHETVLQVLVATGVDVNAPKLTGASPLFMAAQEGHLNAIEVLVKSSADVNQQRNRDGASPLYMAARNGHANVIDALVLHGAGVNDGKFNGVSPIFAAAAKQNGAAVEALARNGAWVYQAVMQALSTHTANGQELHLSRRINALVYLLPILRNTTFKMECITGPAMAMANDILSLLSLQNGIRPLTYMHNALTVLGYLLDTPPASRSRDALLGCTAASECLVRMSYENAIEVLGPALLRILISTAEKATVDAALQLVWLLPGLDHSD